MEVFHKLNKEEIFQDKGHQKNLLIPVSTAIKTESIMAENKSNILP